MSRHMRHILTALVALSLSGCWFETIEWEDKPATENFIRFKIEGKQFESYSSLFGIDPEAYSEGEIRWLRADFDDDDTVGGGILISLPSFEEGTYELTDTLDVNSVHFSLGSHNVQARQYRTAADLSTTLRITRFDTTAMILQGTFTVTGRTLAHLNPPGNWPETLTLIDGEFDFRGERLILR